MIPKLTRRGSRERTWQDALRGAVRSAAELARALELPAETVAASGATDFPLLVPRGFVARMRRRDPHDPLLRQVLPLAAEQAAVAGFSKDPVAEHGLADRGVLQKYPHRALLIASAACPIHCRYCFRRSFPYQAQIAARADWNDALEALAQKGGVEEVILSGGDPLSLSNRRLGSLFEKLRGLPSLRTVRIHTRFPIVLPERVDAGLTWLLRESAFHSVIVVHSNHANELDADVDAALGALAQSGSLLLNQSVLLRGVNDDADALSALSERLFAAGVLPYYLHLLDPVAGAAHFDVGEHEALALLAQIRARLPGYLVPRLVKETPGELSKTLLG